MHFDYLLSFIIVNNVQSLFVPKPFILVVAFQREICRDSIARSSTSIFKFLIEAAELHSMKAEGKMWKRGINIHVAFSFKASCLMQALGL